MCARGVSEIALSMQVCNEEKWQKKWAVINERRRLRELQLHQQENAKDGPRPQSCHSRQSTALSVGGALSVGAGSNEIKKSAGAASLPSRGGSGRRPASGAGSVSAFSVATPVP